MKDGMKEMMSKMRQHMKDMQATMKEMEGMMGESEFDDAFHEESMKGAMKKHK